MQQARDPNDHQSHLDRTAKNDSSDNTTEQNGSEYEVDPHEGADAFESAQEAVTERRTEAPERREDDDIITLDTPD